MPILIPLIFNWGTSGRLVGNLFQREQKRLIARPTQPQKKDKENEKKPQKNEKPNNAYLFPLQNFALCG